MRLAGAAAALAAAAPAAAGQGNGSRSRPPRGPAPGPAAALRFGSGREGQSCPATADPALVRELGSREAAIVARVKRRMARKAAARGGDGNATEHRPWAHESDESPLEVALAELLAFYPSIEQVSTVPQAAARGLHRLEILPGPGVPPSTFGGLDRRPYMLYVPRGYRAEEPIPLWIHAPGTDVAMRTVYGHNGFLADHCTVAMVFLSGLWHRMSVSLHAQGSEDPWPDDVAYTRAVLREVMQRIRVDPRRIRCVGFSRGGRFCSRLASELSGFVSAIAAVSGIRYPEPNNATRPVPVLAIHGLLDAVNPFRGGNPPYWGEGVMDSIHKWANFNNCTRLLQDSPKPGVEVIKYTDCRDDADVVLVKLIHTGHQWPPLGAINARVAILQFFSDHPSSEGCHTVTEGEERFRRCFEDITRAREVEIVQQPHMYEGLTRSSSCQDFQLVMHRQVYADCPQPCQDEAPSAGELWAPARPAGRPPDPSRGVALAAASVLAAAALLLLRLLGLRRGGRVAPEWQRRRSGDYRCMPALEASETPELELLADGEGPLRGRPG